jgi:diaminohydroxyphosphoribosylaminopyrimidine deaminase / 5-amino-6-(5-phosphoribosylamino)uracil reductase
MAELYMLECLALARRGAGRVSPNPMVGCVIVKNGTVIGRGYHRRFGGPHAEVEAIRSASGPVRGSTLYVNLEPCNFHGKTPPCTDLIIRSNIARVVIGTIDPNPLVCGGGIRKLRRAGVSVTAGVLEQECRRFNEFFIKFIKDHTPFVTLKIAQSLDGKITPPRGRSRWISGLESRREVHALRSQYDAVLVGAGTVRKDNPRLTVRHIKGRNPTRVVLDGKFHLNERAAVFKNSGSAATILLVSRDALLKHSAKARRLRAQGVVVLGLEGRRDGALPLRSVLHLLGSRGLSSLLVEGGASLFSSFLRESMGDKLISFIAPEIFGAGLEAFAGGSAGGSRRLFRLRDISVRQVGDDTLLEGYLH